MLINLTPHPITLIREGDTPLVIDPSGTLAPPTAALSDYVEVAGIPIVHQTLGEVEGLPAQREGTWLIVSRMVAAAAPDREDLVVPTDPVWDDQGRTIRCRALHRTSVV